MKVLVLMVPSLDGRLIRKVSCLSILPPCCPGNDFKGGPRPCSRSKPLLDLPGSKEVDRRTLGQSFTLLLLRCGNLLSRFVDSAVCFVLEKPFETREANQGFLETRVHCGRLVSGLRTFDPDFKNGSRARVLLGPVLSRMTIGCVGSFSIWRSVPINWLDQRLPQSLPILLVLLRTVGPLAALCLSVWSRNRRLPR